MVVVVAAGGGVDVEYFVRIVVDQVAFPNFDVFHVTVPIVEDSSHRTRT